MLGWFSGIEGQRFFAFLQEILDSKNRELVTSPKKWRQCKDGNNAVTAVLVDESDILRGQMIILEEIINIPNALRSEVRKEVAALLEKEKK